MEPIAEVLRELAAQLGTTVELLWPSLVAKVQYDWVGSAMVGLVCFIVGWVGFTKSMKATMGQAKLAATALAKSKEWYKVVDDFRYSRKVSELIECTYDQALAYWREAQGEYEAINGFGWFKPICGMVVFGTIALVGTVASLNAMHDISHFLAPEAVALENILRLI